MRIGDWVTLKAGIQDRVQEQMDKVSDALSKLMQRYGASDENSLQQKLEQLKELWDERGKPKRERKAILARRDETSLTAKWQKLDEQVKELEKELEGVKDAPLTVADWHGGSGS